MKDELPTIKRIPDDLWAEIEPLLGEEKVPGTRGRPPVAFRKVFDGIFYVLRTGCQWKELPEEYGSGSTAHRRFQQWVSQGIFEKVWVTLLQRYDDVQGIKWRWQSLDSSSVKAPLGGRRQVPTLPTEARAGPSGTY